MIKNTKDKMPNQKNAALREYLSAITQIHRSVKDDTR